MALYRRKDAGIWYADFYANRKRVQESTGTKNRREAEKFLASLLKSGTLGDELKEKMSSAVMAAVANLKTVVPAAGDTVTARSVRFESVRENELSVVVGGEMQMSEAQAKDMERLATAGTVVERSKAQ